MQHKKIELSKLQAEQDREEVEKRRLGMPGSIRRNGEWTRERKDGPMAFQAKADAMVRAMWGQSYPHRTAR